MVADITRTLHRLIGEDIELNFVPGEGLGHVRVDPVQVEQILMNLAANARDAMPQGGRLTIETAAVELDETYIQKKTAIVPPGRYVLVTVSDNGLDIPPIISRISSNPSTPPSRRVRALAWGWPQCMESSNRTADLSGLTASQAWEPS